MYNNDAVCVQLDERMVMQYVCSKLDENSAPSMYSKDAVCV